MGARVQSFANTPQLGPLARPQTALAKREKLRLNPERYTNENAAVARDNPDAVLARRREANKLARLQPAPVGVETGKLVSVPYSIELKDSPLFRVNYEADYFAEICKRQFDQLYKEGAEIGWVMSIAFHSFLIGQPHCIKYLDEILSYITSHSDTWMITADDIAEYYIKNYYDQAVDHAK